MWSWTSSAAPIWTGICARLGAGGRLIQVGTQQGGEGHLSLDLLLHNHLRIIGTVMKSRSFDEKLAMTNRFRHQPESLVESLTRQKRKDIGFSLFTWFRTSPRHSSLAVRTSGCVTSSPTDALIH
jgi:hypothetical protein